MLRRSLMVGGLVMATAPSLTRIAQAQSGKPVLVFMGHELWGGCKIWRAQSEPDFKKSDAIGKIDYRVVYPADKPLVLKDEAWPAEIRWVRAAFLETDEGKARPDATPRFILAQDKKVILAAAGNAGWKEKMWPKILEVTGTKA